ncbi:uncharacterized protein PRCAT00006139001 [Priceomyces carsonii]|uniref:uncharacterized protein n=1 Tax=Priceomyces carsonii TaxID=28549 RepID=UPI002EDAC44E|nr:unnamed protein product [Priceomyces carsonii]
MKKSPGNAQKAVKNGGGTPSNRMKQASLMSFFKPAVTTKQLPPVVNEVKKEESIPVETLMELENPIKSTPVKGLESEKDSMMDRTTDTPLTSESEGAMPCGDEKRNDWPKSSPVLNNNLEKGSNASNRPDNNSDKNGHGDPTHDSSPLVKRAARRSVRYVESEDEDGDDDLHPGREKRRKVSTSDDEDDNFSPAAEDDEDDNDDDDDDNMSDFIADDNEPSEPEAENSDSEEEERPPKKSKSRNSSRSSGSSPESKAIKREPSNGGILAEKFKAGSSYKSAVQSSIPTESKPKPNAIASPKPKSNFAKENEERYQWLVNVKDAEKRTVDDPNYDPRTLYIPQSAWGKFTPFEKQYWEIKSKLWDTVVFFKKGKFYELYENDAAIANTEFDLKIAGGGRANMKLAGIPEMSFEYWAKEFISHGHKVAKVDQKETLLAKEMRDGSTKEEKIIKRELTGVLTGGTLTDLSMINDDMAIYCLSIKEVILEDDIKTFGVTFVDTATSELNFIEFADDNECTKLETLVAQIKPKEVLCEKGNLCPIAVKILKHNGATNNQIWNNLNPISEFWDYEITLDSLVKSNYYEAEDLDDYSNFPKILVDFKDNFKVAFNAFGGLLYYLKSLMLDEQIMTLANFNRYEISKNASTHLILDGITLNNLEILNNSSDGGDKGTLLKLINRAVTPFGKRMLKKWVLHPLMNVKEINDRYDSVDFFTNGGVDFRLILEEGFLGLPDLERLLARIHSKTLKFKDFVKVIESFEKIAEIIHKLKGSTTNSAGSLHRYMNSFPEELHSLNAEWEDAFDRREALQGIVSPTKGIDSQFDESQSKIDSLEQELNEHLREYKKEYKSNEICYKDSGKEIYLIEVPNKLTKIIPHSWQQMGATAKVKRYWSPEVRTLVRKLLEQKELHKMVCETLKSRMYDRFDKNYNLWMKTIKAIANIDCLLALTKASELVGTPSCRPQFMESEKAAIDFKELRHPCFIGSKDFIPNDVILGGDKPGFALLTGANAAGKSTVMRTTALAVILSQIGCYVPAQNATLTPVDKIMTRLGANDNILQGKSTFFVELSETKKILTNATPASLVILDELGRGGSSSDGYAIAESVLYHLATHVQSLGFFATHYGSLGLSFQNHPQIRPLRMAIIVDNHSRNITFLYRLEEGTAPGSFGMNVASMCGISNKIVERAEIAAKEYEQTSKLKRASENSEANKLSLGVQSDFSWIVNGKFASLSEDILKFDENVKKHSLQNIFDIIAGL